MKNMNNIQTSKYFIQTKKKSFKDDIPRLKYSYKMH